MPVELLNAETLLKVGPRISVHIPGAGPKDRPALEQMVQEELDAIYRDLCNRPGVETPRKLTVVFQFTPQINQQNRLFGVGLDTAIKSSLPEQKMPGVSLGVERGQMFFRTDSIDDARQMTLADAASPVDAAHVNGVPQH